MFSSIAALAIRFCNTNPDRNFSGVNSSLDIEGRLSTG
jgi:hypothetical protein